jgi:hypothetical protein
MQPNYENLLQTSRRVNWRVDEIIGGDKRLDFSKPFLPESFAWTTALPFLSPGEQLTLNHIRAHGYLAMFQLVEAFILPFIAGQSTLEPDDGPFRETALQQFASEEAKHIELFSVFRREFVAEFGVDCGFIGPADEISRAVLAHSPLSVAILVLGIEWMSQGHYVESIRDSRGLDGQFKSLLRHHWIEEAQHAKLDTLVLQTMAKQCGVDDIDRAIDEYFEMGAFLDGGLKQQATFDLDSFERATGRALSAAQRERFVAVQHQALRWTFLGSAMRNRNFLSALGQLSEAARQRVESAAAAFCQPVQGALSVSSMD